MIERADHTRFVLKTPETFGMLGKRRRQNFHRHFPAQPRIARTVHFAHATCTQQGEDFVWSDLSARGQRHGRDYTRILKFPCIKPGAAILESSAVRAGKSLKREGRKEITDADPRIESLQVL
jgi:hypothetical protein